MSIQGFDLSLEDLPLWTLHIWLSLWDPRPMNARNDHIFESLNMKSDCQWTYLVMRFIIHFSKVGGAFPFHFTFIHHIFGRNILLLLILMKSILLLSAPTASFKFWFCNTSITLTENNSFWVFLDSVSFQDDAYLCNLRYAGQLVDAS